MFGFVPDPETPEYPFHPESRTTMLARLVVESDGSVHAGYVPCIIDRRGRPEPVRRADGGLAVFDYVERITRAAGFDTRFTWRGDVVAVDAP